MLTGKGTTESPLISTRLKLMDLSIMTAVEEKAQRIVMIVEQGNDDLYAVTFEIEDFKEIVTRGAQLLNELSD